MHIGTKARSTSVHRARTLGMSHGRQAGRDPGFTLGCWVPLSSLSEANAAEQSDLASRSVPVELRDRAPSTKSRSQDVVKMNEESR